MSSNPSSSSKAVLYSYWRSSCSWRVRVVLTLKGIPFDIKPIDLHKAGGEQKSSEFRSINPIGRVPALQIDGDTFIESIAIINYLEETRQQPALMPQDAISRARVREICELIASGIQPFQNHDSNRELAASYIAREFEPLEKILARCAGRYSVGDKISLADCCLVPQVFNARRLDVDLSPFPTIVRIDQELKDHPAFTATHPSKQPGCLSE